MMKTREFESVKFNKETNKIECATITDFGTVVIKRTPRRHTAEIRDEMLKGIYSFEIQGIMYCYKVVDCNGNMEQYREPEDFRSEDRTTNMVRKSGRHEVNKDKTVLTISEVKPVKVKPVEEKKEEKEETQEVKHSQYETIKACIENDIPVYLAGQQEVVRTTHWNKSVGT